MYNIKTESDFTTGLTLTITIPEYEIDKKALYTIASDTPRYIIPFNYRIVNGNYEFTYQVHKLTKLLHRSGEKSKVEYLDNWDKLMEPFFTYDDWFLNLGAFVLDFEYLYVNSQNEIMYIYVPTLRGEYTLEDMKGMITSFVKKNNVNDMALMNEILWAINDFDMGKLQNIIKENKKNNSNNTYSQTITKNETNSNVSANAKNEPNVVENRGAVILKEKEPTIAPKQVSNSVFDFKINTENNSQSEIVIMEDNKKDKGGLFGRKKEKPVKEKQVKEKPVKEKAEKSKGLLFGKKKEPEEFLVVPKMPAPNIKEVEINVQNVEYNNNEVNFEDDATMILEAEYEVGFSYLGAGTLPRGIEVTIDIGDIFTIGRFDRTKGQKQSSFEFPADTKAVSRCHHAIVERKDDGYYLTDMASAGGTYIDGQKLPANTPFKLIAGNRISFGRSGADYVWEEN